MDEVSTPSSPRPKRARREVIKDPAIQNIISQLISDDEGDESGFESQSQPVVAPVVPVDPADDNSEDSIPLACTEFYRQGSANKENELKSSEALEQEAHDLALLEQAQSLLTESIVAPVAPVEERARSPVHEAEDIKMEVVPESLPEPESEEDSDSQDNAESGMVLTSKFESGGLKLVIKKTPEVHIETEPAARETVKVSTLLLLDTEKFSEKIFQ